MSGVRAATSSKSSMSSGMPNSEAMASRCRTRVGGAAGGGHAGDGVLERVARDDAARSDVATHEVHDQRRRSAARPRPCAGSSAGMPLSPAGERPRNSRHMLIVLAVNWPPQAPAPGAGHRFDLVELLEADLAGPVGTDGLVDADDVLGLALVGARVDRAVVEDDAGDVEARRRPWPRRGWSCRSRTRHDEPVEEVAARHELDRVGHDLAADERGLHALGAHGHAVRDGDGVELHGRAAGLADARLDELRQATLVEVAGHRLDPRRGHADDGPGEVLVGEADGLEHGPRAGPVGTVGQGGRVALGRVARSVVGQARSWVGSPGAWAGRCGRGPIRSDV